MTNKHEFMKNVLAGIGVCSILIVVLMLALGGFRGGADDQESLVIKGTSGTKVLSGGVPPTNGYRIYCPCDYTCPNKTSTPGECYIEGDDLSDLALKSSSGSSSSSELFNLVIEKEWGNESEGNSKIYEFELNQMYRKDGTGPYIKLPGGMTKTFSLSDGGKAPKTITIKVPKGRDGVPFDPNTFFITEKIDPSVNTTWQCHYGADRQEHHNFFVKYQSNTSHKPNVVEVNVDGPSNPSKKTTCTFYNCPVGKICRHSVKGTNLPAPKTP